MKQAFGWSFPDQEEHFIEWMRKTNDVVDGRNRYQGKKFDKAMKWCKSFRVAVDCGAHIGTWSYYLRQRFAQLHAFEPVPEHRDCFLANVEGAILHPFAVGEAPGFVRMEADPKDTGGTHVARTGPAGDVEMRTLDSFELQEVDFIKIDVEGAQLAVVRGAVETLKRCRPCVIVEEKQHIMARNFGTSGTPAVDFLVSLGAVVRRELAGDFILSFD